MTAARLETFTFFRTTSTLQRGSTIFTMSATRSGSHPNFTLSVTSLGKQTTISMLIRSACREMTFYAVAFIKVGFRNRLATQGYIAGRHIHIIALRCDGRLLPGIPDFAGYKKTVEGRTLLGLCRLHSLRRRAYAPGKVHRIWFR